MFIVLFKSIEIDAKKNSCAWLAFEIIWQVKKSFTVCPNLLLYIQSHPISQKLC